MDGGRTILRKTGFAIVAVALIAGANLARAQVLPQEIQATELPPPPPALPAAPDELDLLVRDALGKPDPVPRTLAAPDYAWQVVPAAFWLDGVVETILASPDFVAAIPSRYPGASKLQSPKFSIPTKFAFDRGSLKANVAANVNTSTYASVIPAEVYVWNVPSTSSTGAINGRVEYDAAAWQFYGSTNPSLTANPDGTFSTGTNLTGGTYYQVPQNWLIGRVRTGFELDLTGTAKTRLEYRHKFGTTEGFIAAERIAPFQPSAESDAAAVFRAGLNRKF
jgi:hypothetical protein